MSGIIGGAGSKSGVIGTTELDYEFGTWSPTDLDGSSYHTPDNRDAYYVKIGNQVMIKGWINGFVNSTSTNIFKIANLPFTSGAGQGNHAAGAGTAAEHNFGSGMVVFVTSSANTLYFNNIETGDAGNTALKFSDFYSRGANVYFEAQYQTGY